jgi:AcrR family transcriptional regulator
MYTDSVNTIQSNSVQNLNARDRSRIETRRRLLETGLELFSRQGVATTRASDVASASGVAVGTLYLHFKDKQGLLRAILREGVEELMSALQQMALSPVPEPAAAVRAHTEILVRFAESHPGLCRILFDPESVRTNISTEITEHLVAMQEQRLREGAAKGVIPPCMDPTVAAHGVVGMLLQVLNWWARNPGTVPADTVIETLTRLRLSGLYQC